MMMVMVLEMFPMMLAKTKRKRLYWEASCRSIPTVMALAIFVIQDGTSSYSRKVKSRMQYDF
jgi:hypothetical protein